ncbi:MAG: phosphotransferase family protein [bacterium]
MTAQELAQRFCAYLAHRLPDARDIRVPLVNPIFGGASRETFSMELSYRTLLEPVSQRVILRREFESGIIDTSIATEYKAYQAFRSSQVPVPRVFWSEHDPRWLGTPFYVMEEILDCEALHVLFSAPPFRSVREQVGRSFCTIMGTIARTDPAAVGLRDGLEPVAPEDCWKRELTYWMKKAEESELEPQPVLRAAIRWLWRRPPPPARKIAIVHGDMRAGNFLFNEDGVIRAVLDWEMMHLGDPLEDLSWSLNRLWSWTEPDRIGIMIPREEGIRVWEEASGQKVDLQALFWWEVFTSVKSMAIWLSMNKKYATGANTDPIVGYGGIWALDLQRRILMEQMRRAHETHG